VGRSNMQRLFSSFARGWPGLGLLLTRFVAATALAHQGYAGIHHGAPITAILTVVATAGAAISLFVGLWTPVGGVLAACVEMWNAITQPGDMWVFILLATFGIALALLGPGAWSVDARLFGWKRIAIPSRKS
jgi:putative oxidoreductase